ncbi:MAG: hypothetical protein AB9922_05975 [Bacteroidales bacterium]
MAENNISVIEKYITKYPWFSIGYIEAYRAMCSMEADLGDAYLSKAASHVWSRSKLYEIYRNSINRELQAETPEIKPAVKEQVVVESTPVVVESIPEVVKNVPVVVESAPVVVENTPVVIESSPVVVESTPPVIESKELRALKEVKLAPQQPRPQVNKSEDLIEFDDEGIDGDEILLEGNSFVITEQKPKFVLAGGDYFSKKDFEQIELDTSKPLDSFIAEKPSLLRSAMSGKSIKPIPEEELEEDQNFEDASYYTETLATIYVEQGFYKRALDVYAKLILLFPEKSAYFATLVKEIKNKYNT